MDRNYKLAKRRYVIGGVVLTVVVLFIIRLFALQILSDDYRKNADSNAFLKKIQYPSRGVIYDRTGKLLVYNQPAYDITVVMKEITSLDTLDLCRTLRITPEFLRRKFRDLKDRRLNPGYSPYTNQVFLTQLSAEDCGVFQEKLFKFPGFYIQRRTIRQYNYNSGAHILGDIGEVSKQEMEDDEYYLPGDFIGNVDTARLIKREVSDGVIAPGYEPEALELLKQKKKGNYNIIQIDPDYVPAPLEHKEVFGITFEQGRNELNIDKDFFSNVVTDVKEIPDAAKIDLAISMITLKYTQSNSVCYVKDGQAIGIGAGQQSRIHCTRLAGQKADNWWLRQNPKVLGLQFKDGIGRADRDNAIDLYIGEEYMDVLADGVWENTFKVKPEVFTREEKRAWLDQLTGVALGSDAFFPFGDNIERAHKSGVTYIAQPGGSVRDDNVIATCNKYGMAMAFTGIRLFHH